MFSDKVRREQEELHNRAKSDLIYQLGEAAIPMIGIGLMMAGGGGFPAAGAGAGAVVKYLGAKGIAVAVPAWNLWGIRNQKMAEIEKYHSENLAVLDFVLTEFEAKGPVNTVYYIRELVGLIADKSIRDDLLNECNALISKYPQGKDSDEPFVVPAA